MEESKSWMQEAYNATIRLFNTRIKRYKALIIGIAIVVFGSVIWAIVWKSWSPFLCLIIPISLCGIYLSSDLMLIYKWQNIVLNLWIYDELDIGLFIDTVSQVRMLPKETLQSLLKTLPERELAGKVPKEIKESIKMTIKIINQCQVDRIVFSTCAYSMGLGFLAFALLHQRWLMLFGSILVVPVFFIGKASCYIRLVILRRKIKQLRIDLNLYMEFIDKLDYKFSQEIKKVFKF
ncbi:TPA: hypothetical protein ENS27_11055 [bacterium]|nr:hypothetical protein [bacterium]